MITAKEARKKVDSLIEQAVEELKSKCESEINFAIEQREYSISFEAELSDARTDKVFSEVKEYLESEPNCYEVSMEKGKSSVVDEGSFDPLVMKIEIKW